MRPWHSPTKGQGKLDLRPLCGNDNKWHQPKSKVAYRSRACFAASPVRHMAIRTHARSERRSERTHSMHTCAIFSSESLLCESSSRSRPGDFDPSIEESGTDMSRPALGLQQKCPSAFYPAPGGRPPTPLLVLPSLFVEGLAVERFAPP